MTFVLFLNNLYDLWFSQKYYKDDLDSKHFLKLNNDLGYYNIVENYGISPFLFILFSLYCCICITVTKNQRNSILKSAPHLRERERKRD